MSSDLLSRDIPHPYCQGDPPVSSTQAQTITVRSELSLFIILISNPKKKHETSWRNDFPTVRCLGSDLGKFGHQGFVQAK